MTKLLKGNVSFTVFKPEKTPENIEKTREALAEYAFQRLAPADLRDESVGWVDAVLCFDNENFSSLLHDGFFVFALREDKYSFTAAQLRPYIEEAEFVFKRENSLEYIAAQQKKEIKEQVIRRMRTNSYPKTTVTEAAWDMDSGLVYLFSQSGATIAKFTDVFEKSFQISLDQVSLFDSVKELGGADRMEPVFTRIWGDEK